MTFAARLTRSPIPYDARLGADTAAQFPDQPPEMRGLIAGIAGCSPYLRASIEKDTGWLNAALDAGPEPSMAALMEVVRNTAAPDLQSGLRVAKRRVALLVALADLGGVWQLERVTGALTEFADLATDRALRATIGHEITRGKLPGGDETGATVALAMGKMGAHELNYSSDIDLIMLFEGEAYDPADYHEARSALVRATRRMARLLSEITGEGYVFRTDLRLRPDASVTPVCLSMEAAESYYESVGRTWERAAYIKARPCAGDLAAGDRFVQRLTPFVWRKHFDFAAIQDAHDMRLRIREHKGTHRRPGLEGLNMKLGPGGIREIEFFTQTRQIIAGGRDPSLRVRGTVEGLARLAAKGWVGEDIAATLTDAYRAHREVEHRLQMIADAQTHDLPGDAGGFDRLAAFMGVETRALRADLGARLQQVHELTEGFFAPGATAAAPDIPGDAQAVVDTWHSYPALRSARSMEIFERLKPDIIRRLGKAARPQEALEQFDGFLAGLPAGVQVFSLFEANPQLIDLIVDIASTSPALARYLGRNAQVFDAVIGGSFFDAWPGQVALQAALTARVRIAGDYEAQLDAARRWKKEWHFRIGVHHLRGVIDAAAAGQHYADLAQAVLGALWAPVVEDFARKHGDPPGRGAVVLGMGSLGAGQLSATSDLDLIVIYDAAGVDMSGGRRPLAARVYFARLTKAFVTAITTQTAEGTLYEVDMRLRPSGQQGPVATSLESFRSYQQDEAWTWEHLALTRARPVAGARELGDEVEDFRRGLLAEPRDVAKTLRDVVEMRQRLAEAKPARNAWEAKRGPGRMQDVDLLAQTAALLAGSAARQTADQLAAGVSAGWLPRAVAEGLAETHARFWTVQAAARLLTGIALEISDVGEGGRGFLLRQTGAPSAEALAGDMAARADAASGMIDTVLQQEPARN
ncbi:MAG: glutamine-synthetase adenylyltransferase [Rhodobacteraceae bacterium]|nr:glutamine-synthetase adenylyltransferase [Paracoccaceae bacterium]